MSIAILKLIPLYFSLGNISDAIRFKQAMNRAETSREQSVIFAPIIIGFSWSRAHASHHKALLAMERDGNRTGLGAKLAIRASIMQAWGGMGGFA